MRATSIGIRRVVFALVVLGVMGGVGWLVGGEFSPLHKYFLDHVVWPNRLMAINFPAFLIAGLVGGNFHAPPGWAMLAGFLAQWFSIGLLLSLVVVRPVARAGMSPRGTVGKPL